MTSRSSAPSRSSPEPRIPSATPSARDREFSARATAGFSHVVYAKSPGGVVATARRTAHWRPLVERTAARHHLDPDLLEALVFLESAGRPDVWPGATSAAPPASPRSWPRPAEPAGHADRRGAQPQLPARSPRRAAGPGPASAAAERPASKDRRALRPRQGARGHRALPRQGAPALRPRGPEPRLVPHGHRQSRQRDRRLRREQPALRAGSTSTPLPTTTRGPTRCSHASATTAPPTGGGSWPRAR